MLTPRYYSVVKAVGRLIKRVANAALARVGHRLTPLPGSPASTLAKRARHDETVALPPGTQEILRPDNPRLAELRRRYAANTLAASAHSHWNKALLDRDLDLPFFRGDNAYVWQLRNVRDHARLKYFLLGNYVRALDGRGLLDRLTEDGLFGCFRFQYEGWPALSRDLLDSINEMYFLDRHWGLFGRKDVRVLDIGAGYGRMAHRMTSAVEGVSAYFCTDAVPESTFLSEFYLGFRGCDRAHVIPLDELARLDGERIDLAINIHSFSEMSLASIEFWLEWLRQHRVPSLLIVPNLDEGFLSIEPDRSRRDFSGAIARSGYRLKASEPVLADANVRELSGIVDRIFLFEAIR